MICRAGQVAGDVESGPAFPGGPANGSGSMPQPRGLRLVAVVLVVACVLALSPHRRTIPPAIESDYCYQLIAADRLVAGDGLTSLQPVAPLQEWNWQYDWGFLTQWPVGYSLLVAGVRWITGVSTIAACQWISIAACAFAMVGWFAWMRHSSPRGIAGLLVSLLAAGSAISLASLVNPTTDIIVIAGLPWILLLVASALTQQPDATVPPQRAMIVTVQTLCVAGFFAGMLTWFRYAAIFIPVGIVAFLVIRAIIRRCGKTMIRAAIFTLASAVPIIALLAINAAYSQSSSTAAQLNLGDKLTFAPSWSLVWTAWWRFTDLGFYNYHKWSHWISALAPFALAAFIILAPRVRTQLLTSLSKTHWGLSAFIVFTGLFMLVAATALFGQKFNYVALDRYYEPLKPLYFLMFVVPLLALRSRLARPMICVAAVIGCSWIVQQEWGRTYNRWSAAQRESTAYGQWATCFSPGAKDVYQWLKDQATPDLIVVSNFHEYVALETGIATLPIPKDRATLDSWVEKIAADRNLTTEPRIIYVLDSSPRWRDYWIPPTAEIVDSLRLNQKVIAFKNTNVYEDSPTPEAHLARAAPVSE